MPRVTTEQICG